jgi:hypothetical protein
MIRSKSGPVWRIAATLAAEYGLEEAYCMAYAKSHPYTSFGADPDPTARLAWGKVAARLRWMAVERYEKRREREAEATAVQLGRERRPLNVRQEAW